MFITPIEYMILTLVVMNPIEFIGRFSSWVRKELYVICGAALFIFTTTLLVFFGTTFISSKNSAIFIVSTGILLIIKGSFNLVNTSQPLEPFNFKQSYLNFLYPFLVPIFISPELLCVITAATYDYSNVFKINIIGINIALAFIVTTTLLLSESFKKNLSTTFCEIKNKLFGIVMIYFGVLFIVNHLSNILKYVK